MEFAYILYYNATICSKTKEYIKKKIFPTTKRKKNFKLGNKRGYFFAGDDIPWARQLRNPLGKGIDLVAFLRFLFLALADTDTYLSEGCNGT